MLAVSSLLTPDSVTPEFLYVMYILSDTWIYSKDFMIEEKPQWFQIALQIKGSVIGAI
ncbi:MAG: hypothetical protein RLZZ176_1789, partial [Cyanobacteriota bacterium]